MILSTIYSGVLLLFKSFVPWYKMIAFRGEVSCKHPLTWLIMPFVVVLGIDFTDTWDFFVCLTSILQNVWWWNHWLSGFLFCHHYGCYYFHPFCSLLFFADCFLHWSLSKWYIQWRFLLMMFALLCVELLVVGFSRSFTISIGSSRLCSLLVWKIHSDIPFWL